MCRPMGRRTETSMAPSSRRQRLATLVADRVIDAVLALASLSTLLGTTAGRGSGAHNICAGHGSCARLLAADGPKLGQGRRPALGIGAQDERLAAELHCAQSAGAYLLIRRLTADPVGITEVFERESSSVHFQFTYVCGGGRESDHRCLSTNIEAWFVNRYLANFVSVQCPRIFRSSPRTAA